MTTAPELAVPRSKFEYLKGDKPLWMAVIVLSVLSIFPVYSASSNLEYIVQNGTTTGHIFKHMMFIIVGLALMRGMQVIRYQAIGYFSRIVLVISIIFLCITLFTGKSIDGASASRWIYIPGTAMGFQPSAFAFLALIVYLCRYLGKGIFEEKTEWKKVAWVFIPILIVAGLVFRDNGSTGLLIIAVSIAVLILGQFPFKYILGFLGIVTVLGGLFIFIGLKTDLMPNNRIHTWMSRIDIFTGSKEDADDEAVKAKNYQTNQAKAAIVHGGITGIGPGKSALKQMLPQSASDFIFAIIIEEYGLLGAGFLLIFYFIIFYRVVLIAQKIPALFGTLLALSMGIMIFAQLAANVLVALNLMPVTGQPLPLISYGGTSMLVTYMQLGLVLNVSSAVQLYTEEGMGKAQTLEAINDIA